MTTSTLPLLPLLLADVPRSLVRALEQDGIPTEQFNTAPFAGQFVLFDSRRRPCPALVVGQQAIDVRSLIESPSDDPWTALDDLGSQRTSWQLGELTVQETIARVDKRKVRRAALSKLQQVIEQRGGIWLQLAPVPWPYRTVFNLRADHDSYIAEDFDRFLTVISGHEASVSHFICAGGFNNQHEVFDRLREHNVGSHGYWHHTYTDAESNRCNIMRGIDVLQAAGINPSGFVAPHGRCNPALRGVLDELGISHSGEFSLAWDDWPWLADSSSVLQIPVHPICLGIALEVIDKQRPGDDSARDRAAVLIAQHFERYILAQHAAAEPIMLYGHPDGRLGRYPAVVRQLLQVVDSLPDVWQTTQTNLARWWRLRHSIRLGVQRSADSLIIEMRNHPQGFTPALDIWCGGRVARVKVDGTKTVIEPQRLHYEQRAEPFRLDSRPVDEPVSLRDRFKHWIDWEKATPVEELRSRSVRGWLKRRLRGMVR